MASRSACSEATGMSGLRELESLLAHEARGRRVALPLEQSFQSLVGHRVVRLGRHRGLVLRGGALEVVALAKCISVVVEAPRLARREPGALLERLESLVGVVPQVPDDPEV